MPVLIAVLLAVPAAALVGVLCFLLGRKAGRERALGFESRLYRFEFSANREARDRLRIMRHRTGLVYLDGLVHAADQEVAQQFEAGLRHASKGYWERTLQEWTVARKRATGGEVVALDFLIGCCQMMSGRAEQARALLLAALGRARKLGDRPAAASCHFVLGRLEAEAKRDTAARVRYAASARLWQVLDVPELQARAMIQDAEAAERLKDWTGALESQRRALRLLERAGDKVGAAARYGAIGAIMARQGQLDQARAAHEDGLHLARQTQDRLAEAERLAAIGDIHLAQESPKRALDLFDRALKAFRDAHRLRGQTQMLERIAVCHRRLGEVDVALEYYEQALKLGRRLGDRQLIARSLEGVADGVAVHGADDRAQALLEEAVRLDRETGSEPDLARHLTSLGRVLLLRHEATEALKVLEEAAAAGRRGGDAEVELAAAVEMSQALRHSGRVAEATALLERYRGRPAAGPALRARVHAEAGLCLLSQGDARRAVDELRQAAELYRPVGGREHGLALVNLGSALSIGQEQQAGRQSIEDGLRQLRATGTRSDEAWALRALAEASRRGGEPGPARQNLLAALELLREEKDGLAEAECLVSLGRLALGESDVASARAHLEQAARVYSRAGADQKAKETTEELRRLPLAGAGVQFLDEQNLR